MIQHLCDVSDPQKNSHACVYYTLSAIVCAVALECTSCVLLKYSHPSHPLRVIVSQRVFHNHFCYIYIITLSHLNHNDNVSTCLWLMYLQISKYRAENKLCVNQNVSCSDGPLTSSFWKGSTGWTYIYRGEMKNGYGH